MKKLPSSILKTLEEFLELKKGETIGIIIDKTYKNLGEALFEILLKAGYETNLLRIPELKQNGQILSETIYRFMLAHHAILAPMKYSITHSPQSVKAAEKGVKIVTMPRIPLISFQRGAMTADFKKVKERTKKLKEIVEGFNRFVVVSKNFELEIVRESRPIFGVQGKYPANLPDGEVFFAPMEGKSRGEFFAEFFGEFGRNVYFRIEKGQLVSCKNISLSFLKVIKQNPLAANLAEMGIGTNDKALKINNILEAEKILGTVHIAFGTNASMGGKINAGFHNDAVTLKPTLFGIEDNGKRVKIIENGRHLYI
jgi:leucyl aminopeptidase (aminopeptidase T)